MDHNKPTIMIVSEDPSVHTGLARVTRSIFNRIYTMKKYNLVQVAYAGPGVEPIRWKLIHTKRDMNGNADINDRYGQETFEEVLNIYKPNIVFGYADPQVIRYLGESSLRPLFDLVTYLCVDSEPIHPALGSIFEKSTRVVTFGKWPQQVVKDSFGVDSVIIPHGIDSDVFKKDINKRKKIRDLIGLSDDQILIGTVSQNQPRKNLLEALKLLHYLVYGRYITCNKCNKVTAFKINPVTAEIREAYDRCRHCNSLDVEEGKPNPSINWYYHGPLKSVNPWHLEMWTCNYKLEKNVIFSKNKTQSIGLLDIEFTGIYNAIDIFYLPTSAEGFGLPTAEAMACEVPVVLPNYSAHVDWAGSGGILVDYHEMFVPKMQCIRAIIDLESSIAAVNTLLCPDYRKELGKKGREKILEFNWDDIAKQWVDLFDDVLSNQNNALWHKTTEI